jgi:drug/metabolite transporter (DMT)-like permease
MIVLNEEFGWRTLAGGAMIISGIALIVVRKRKPEIQLVGSNQIP